MTASPDEDKMQQGTLARPGQQCHWRRLDRRSGEGNVLMLHGAGVAAEQTWGPMMSHLDAWRTLLMPDLRGMGATREADGHERPFSLDEVVDDVDALLDAQAIAYCDVIGYSFGGLVAMRLKQRLGDRIGRTFLLEPALLEREDHATMVRVRAGYADAARAIREASTPETGIVAFLDLIAPHRTRNPRAERMMIRRLAHRPLGFANALDCVTDAVRHLDRDVLLAAQSNVTSVVGGKSLSAMHAYHAILAQRRRDWRYIELPGTDHSLPFQKPRRLAALLQEVSTLETGGRD
ncbi:pimeloyl-ACP methyl ester carboxylesterase [Chromohalobacter marismortui]|uniref:Pimeloyl-ACP methyl ester carboxylesterase n=1 Tax=Chromohalobacter marismortui TaxID=42055 RepID=A0A4R7NDB3_9GAMM|nr:MULTISPECIES: alpha/beta hydrolase [Chromohalobacter]MCI0510008.1 alpha/beta hydrolase [Chromohalobacter sp.]MCI0594868.1 alpha/beta hydrolase [Chromohalobacter sp.]TDU18031.1 pimeloyl-ACP methyl ester carboxylesterase [Chromohalobacter marismortui]